MVKINFWICIGLLVPLINSFAQDQYSYIGFDAPVSTTQYGGYYYLSNLGKGQQEKDGDGYISRVKSDGSQEEVTMKYLTGLNNPRGIYAIKGVLYICDMDRLVGIDLNSRKKVFELSLEKEKTRQLTDIVAVNNNTVYVSATDVDAIYEINLDTRKYQKWAEAVAPTGLLLEKDRLYACSWGTDSLPNGKLGYFDIKKKNYTLLSDYQGYLWGLALDGKRLYFSDWVMPGGKRGEIKWVNLETNEIGQIKLTTRVGGPADFLYDSRNNIFIIPAVTENLVYGALGFK